MSRPRARTAEKAALEADFASGRHADPRGFDAFWPAAIEAVRARYGDAAIVVPGHGEAGTLRALDRTLELLRSRPKP